VSIRGKPVTQGSVYPEPEFVPYRHPGAEPAGTVPPTPPRAARTNNFQRALKEAKFARFKALRDGGATKAEARAQMGLGRSTADTYDHEYRQQRGGGA